MIRWNRYYRKTWFLAQNRRIALEFSTYPTFAAEISVRGYDSDVTFHLGILFGIYLSFTGFLPNHWYPDDTHGSKGNHYGSKEISIQIQDWMLLWRLWSPSHDWDSTISKYRDGSFDINTFLLGTTDLIQGHPQSQMFVMPMIEDNYMVKVTGSIWTWKRKRWYARPWQLSGMRYQVESGYYENHEWIPKGIAVPGKRGNQDDSALGNVTLGVNTAKNHEDAFFTFWKMCMDTRSRYAGENWIPEGSTPKDIVNRINKAYAISKDQLLRHINSSDLLTKTVVQHRLQ